MNKLELEDPMVAYKTPYGNMFTTPAALITEVDGEPLKRVALYTRIDNIPDDDGTDVYYVVCGLEGGRQLIYRLEDTDGFKFNEKTGVAKFVSGDMQYKIRALEDSDKSWLLDDSMTGDQNG